MDPMARLCGHVSLNSIKDSEFVDEIRDGQLLHFIVFLLRTKCKVGNDMQSNTTMSIKMF